MRMPCQGVLPSVGTMRNRSIRHALGLSLPAITGLALLAIPRVVAHDLGGAGPVLNSVLTFGPIAVWLVVVLWRRVPNAFVTLVAIGAAYGLLLGVAHQVFWSTAFGGESPSLGGNLAGVLDPGAEGILLRVVAFASSLMTGIFVGAIAGAVGWALARVVPGFRPRQRTRDGGVA